MIKADLHTHTNCSHAANSLAEMLSAAKEKQLYYFGISEHSPRPQGYTYPSDYQEKLAAAFPCLILELQSLCLKQDENFNLLLGVEIDYLPSQEDFARNFLKQYAFDYVIGGLHFQNSWGFDYSAQDWKSKSTKEKFACYEQYYLDLGHMCRSNLIDIVAHPDLIKIYSSDTFKEWLKLADSKKLILNTLNDLKKNDLIMEVSSAGLRKDCKEIYPNALLMEMAADLELKICLSSDAHSSTQITYAFEELNTYVKKFGYTHTHIINKGNFIKLALD